PLPFDLSGHSDVLDIGYLTTSVKNVEWVNNAAISGPIVSGAVDLTQSSGAFGMTSDLSGVSDQVKAAAAAAPLVAVLDPQGRLIPLTIDPRGFDKDMYRVFTFSNYGSPHAIKPPKASSVVQATTKNYGFFNS